MVLEPPETEIRTRKDPALQQAGYLQDTFEPRIGRETTQIGRKKKEHCRSPAGLKIIENIIK